MGNKDRFVDELLNSALAHHRTAEPRRGLEARILERVRAGASEQRAGGNAWKLGIAIAVTAVIVVFVAIRVANRSQSPAVDRSQTANAVPSAPPKEALVANSGTTPKAGNPITVVEPKRAAHWESKMSRRVKESSRQVEAHHWPSQFPTPSPLTAEQKALVQYVRETPPKVLAEPILKAGLTVQHVEIKPLAIPPLEIKPLAFRAAREDAQ